MNMQVSDNRRRLISTKFGRRLRKQMVCVQCLVRHDTSITFPSNRPAMTKGFHFGISLKAASVWSHLEHNFKTFVHLLATCHFFFFRLNNGKIVCFIITSYYVRKVQHFSTIKNIRSIPLNRGQIWTRHINYLLCGWIAHRILCLREMESLWMSAVISCSARTLGALLWKPIWKRLCCGPETARAKTKNII